ncbi:MAG: RNA 2',3'-cyclic phosphodiesterase, partial [Verrucomicrobia bacterium]|nr:RNA 2',3'-cyclic phosphodiesterase [Verrucomicrobiota bacterium]
PAVADLTAALARACAGVVPFRVTARGIGFFPHVRSPRVAWIGLESAGIILADLRQRVEQAAAPFGKRTESQKFAPHATLGRFKRMNRCDLKKFLDAVIPFRDRNFGEWQAREIFLMRSQLSSSGSRHVALSSFPLDAK